MSQVNMSVQLLNAPETAETVVSMAARLCYSSACVDDLHSAVCAKDQAAFINRLVDMGHMSPVEHVSFTFGIEGVSRALLAQITRHRIASFSVQSQRYVDQTAGGFDYIVPPSVAALGSAAVEKYTAQMQTIAAWYAEWVDELGGANEKARQDARFVLPNAAETKMLCTMNARELMHFFRLRCCERAQWEIRALAWAMMGLCMKAAPALFCGCGPSCATGSCTEGKMSCGRAAEIREKQRELQAFVEEHKNDADFAVKVSKWASDRSR